MAEQGQHSVRIEAPRSMGWKQRGLVVGALGLSAALMADKIGLIDMPMPGVGVDTEVGFEIGGVENPEIILTGNICPVTVAGEVDTSMTAKQHIQIGIGGFGPTKSLTIMNGTAHVEGAVEACTTGEDTTIRLNRIVDTKAETVRYGMDISVEDVFAHGARVTNLGQPGAVDCGMTNFYEFADMIDDIGEESMCGAMQELGSQAMEQAVCFPEAQNAFKTGFKDTVLGIANQVMTELGEEPIDEAHVTVTIHDEQLTAKQTDPADEAAALVREANAAMPDGVTFKLESLECAKPTVTDDALESDAVHMVPSRQARAKRLEAAQGE